MAYFERMMSSGHQVTEVNDERLLFVIPSGRKIMTTTILLVDGEPGVRAAECVLELEHDTPRIVALMKARGWDGVKVSTEVKARPPYADELRGAVRSWAKIVLTKVVSKDDDTP